MIKLQQILAENEIQFLLDDISKSIDKYNIIIESSNGKINEAAGDLVKYIISKIAQAFLKIIDLLKKFKNISDKIVLNILSMGDKIIKFMAKFKDKYPGIFAAIKIILIIVIIFAIFALLTSTSYASTPDDSKRVSRVLDASISFLHEFSRQTNVNDPDYFDKSEMLNKAITLLDYTKDTLKSGDTIETISAELTKSFNNYNDFSFKFADTAINTMNSDPEKFSQFIKVWDSMKSLIVNNILIK